MDMWQKSEERRRRWGKNQFRFNFTIFFLFFYSLTIWKAEKYTFSEPHIYFSAALVCIVCCSTKSQTWLITRHCDCDCQRHCSRLFRVQGVSEQPVFGGRSGPHTKQAHKTVAESPDRNGSHPPKWPLGALRFLALKFTGKNEFNRK